MNKPKTEKDEFPSSTHSIDVEQQFILRLPEAAAENLRKVLQSAPSTLKERLSMEIHPELRKGKVICDGQMYSAKLYDLPCIVESYKTTDRKTFYKTADVSQILICSTNFDDDDSAVEEESAKKKDKDKKFNWMHGLCPPFKSVRKRRFRKIIPKKHPEQPDTDKELRRLFATDSQAIEVKYEVIEEDDESQHQGSAPSGNRTKAIGGGGGGSGKNFSDSLKASKIVSPHKGPFADVRINKSSPSPADDILPTAEDVDGGLDENNHMDIFGDVSSSEDGEEGLADRSLTRDHMDIDFGDSNMGPTESNQGDVMENMDSSQM